ncbi:hypothetical protein NDU88_001885 [Pleurodeles waltl]|uniref:Uncharacterized protein n=1 Tax=Pleurodeles waltl TaxID=8319 RepID=A0AAV7R8I5_PLEWA|nr:hypothetical protein NDU88_001885 [Pleurodeles waltl]
MALPQLGGRTADPIPRGPLLWGLCRLLGVARNLKEQHFGSQAGKRKHKATIKPRAARESKTVNRASPASHTACF